MRTFTLYFVGLVLVSAILGASLYLQFYDGILPCPLCTLQRLAFFLLGVVFLIGLIVQRFFWGRILTNVFIALSSLLGIAFAGRQVWLQHMGTASNTECGVSLEYMLNVLPLDQVMKKVFQGSSECTAPGFEFLSLNMAEWALIWFSLFLLMSFYLLLKEIHWHNHE